MNKPLNLAITVSIALASFGTKVYASPYSFGGNCPSQGAWTQMALQQTQQIEHVVNQLKDIPECKGITSVVRDLQAATAALSTPQDEVRRENRLENIPVEMSALRSGVMDGGKVNDRAASMLLNRTIEAASVSSQMSQANSGKQSDIASVVSGISQIF